MKTSQKNKPAHNVHTPIPPQVMDPTRHRKQHENPDRRKDMKSKTMQDDLDDRKLAPREEL